MKQGKKVNRAQDESNPKKRFDRDPEENKNFLQKLIEKRKFDDERPDEEDEEFLLDELGEELLEDEDDYWDEYFKSTLNKTIKINRHKLK